MEYGRKRFESSVSTNNVIVEYSENSTDEQGHSVRRSVRKRKQPDYYGDEDSNHVVRVKKRVDSSTLLYVLAPDGKELLGAKRRESLFKKYLRILVIAQGCEVADQLEKIKCLYENQDVQNVRAYAKKEKIDLKAWFMQCPSCSQILHNSKNKQGLLNAVFTHWFLRQVHQPALHQYASKMFADSESDAKEKYAKYKNVVPKVIPWPGDDESEREDEESTDDEQGLDNDPPSPKLPSYANGSVVASRRDNHAIAPNGASAGELSEESMHDSGLMDIDQDQDNEQMVPVNDFFIVETKPNYLNVFTVFIGHSIHEVIYSYAMAKLPQLEEQFSSSADILEQDEVIVKQLMVQGDDACRRLICPSKGCFQRVAVEEDDEQVAKKRLLFDLVAHQLSAHKEESMLYKALEKRVGHNFLDAQAKSRNLPAVGHQPNNQLGEN